MKIETIGEKEEKLLFRKEVLLKAEFEKSTPSKENILKEVSEHLKINPEVVKLEKVGQRFGERTADILIYVYSNKENLKKIETINKKAKKENKKEEPKK